MCVHMLSGEEGGTVAADQCSSQGGFNSSDKKLGNPSAPPSIMK